MRPVAVMCAQEFGCAGCAPELTTRAIFINLGHQIIFISSVDTSILSFFLSFFFLSFNINVFVLLS